MVLAKKKTVFVGLSGGVDSSVSAYLLKKESYDVVGVYMKNWSGDEFGIQADCPWEQDQADCIKVCKQLDIPFMSFNFEKEYREKVVEYFFSEYEKGRTPNPDVMCNKEIKFDLFLNKSLAEGADMIATGHYAKVVLESGEYSLLKGVDTNKDQSYFLHALNQNQLSKTLFPIGHLIKPQVREIAKEANLVNAEKKDSQGICFIGEINVQQYLRSQIEKKPGNIIDQDSGKVVGKHDGVMFYTIGQREGLGIGGAKEPYFVIGKDADKREVYVVMGNDNPKLFKKNVDLENMHLISPNRDKDYINNINLEGSVRYRHKAEKMKFVTNLEVEFDKPQRAISEGQSLVVYEGDRCLGGGIMKG